VAAAARRGAPAKAKAKPKAKGGRGALLSRPMELDFPARLVDKPILYELIKRFDLVPNIKRANVTRDFGYIQLELKGTPQSMEAGLAYLKKAGVTVAPIEKDVVES
jgi:ABC-type methionine transport system ATPase subunit